MWSIIHQLHQLFGFVDDGCPVAPGKNSSKKTGDFYILFFCKEMRNGNGVIFNKRRLIVLINLPV